jgi:hypothetical protein
MSSSRLPRGLVISSGAVLGPLEVDREVLLALPEDFLFRYEQVWLKAYGASVGGRSSGGVIEPNVVSSTKRVTRTSTSQTETRGGAHSGKKLAGSAERRVVADEMALKFKRKIDAELRKLNRAMRGYLSRGGEVGGSVGRRCSMCKRFGEDEWVYCPWDGKAMEEREA